MSALSFLVVAAVISVVGSAYLWVRYRQPKQTLTSSIDDFRREMSALAPDKHDERPFGARPGAGD